MVKYGFRIKTRSGLVVDNLTIQGRDQSDAEKKLFQMYHHCEILECRTGQISFRDKNPDLDGIITRIAKQDVLN
jgi:hypothetical protein